MVVLDMEVIEVVKFCLLPMGCKLLRFEVQIEDLFLRIKPYLIRLCLVRIVEARGERDIFAIAFVVCPSWSGPRLARKRS